MWVQYKQGQAITPQQKNAPKMQSLHYHPSEVVSSTERLQIKTSVPQSQKKTIEPAHVSIGQSQENSSEKQNNVIDETYAHPTFLRQAMRFTDDLQSITNPHIAQTAKMKEHYNETPCKHTPTQQGRALIIFVCLYLIGAVLSGVLYAVLSSTQAQYLSYYLSHFVEAIEHTSMIAYCINLCGICAISLTSVALLGLSALGLPLLFVLLFLKGIGTGMLILQFFAQYQWYGIFYYFASVGVVDVCLATGLCLLACTAAKNASVLFQVVLSPERMCDGYKARQLAGRYLVLLFFLIVICLLCAIIFRGLFGNF